MCGRLQKLPMSIVEVPCKEEIMKGDLGVIEGTTILDPVGSSIRLNVFLNRCKIVTKKLSCGIQL